MSKVNICVSKKGMEKCKGQGKVGEFLSGGYVANLIFQAHVYIEEVSNCRIQYL